MVYKTLRSKRKSFSIEITPSGEVIVRAPLHASDKLIEALVNKKEKWINEHLSKVLSRSAEKELTSEQINAYIAAAKAILPDKVRYFANIMGVCPTGITITGAKKRFGSCSFKNRICFSYHLMRYPEQAIDYVVVHELAHILHKDHSKNFYACIEKYMPDYKDREKLLKEPLILGE